MLSVLAEAGRELDSSFVREVPERVQLSSEVACWTELLSFDLRRVALALVQLVPLLSEQDC
jgi:hypothetical protein